MWPVNYVLDTAVRPNLILEELFESDEITYIRACDNPRLRSVTNEKVEIVGTIVLYVRIGESLVRVMFGIVRNLAVPALLGTSLIDKFNKGIIPTKPNIILFSSLPVLILLIHGATNEGTAEEEIMEAVDITLLLVEPESTWFK